MSSKMKKWLLPVILPLPVIWACQNAHQEQGIDSENQELSLSEDPESRGDTDTTEEGSGEEIYEENVEEGEFGPMGPVTMTWIDIDFDGTTALKKLNLKVENISLQEVKVSVDILCQGFINRELVKKMEPATQTIPVGEAAMFSISADKLPIQVLKGAGKFMALAQVILQNEYTSDEPKVRINASFQYCYRHSADYKSINVFRFEKYVEEEGVFVNPDVDSAEEVGLILDENDVAVPLLASDVQVNVVGEGGEDYGTITGTSAEIIVVE